MTAAIGAYTPVTVMTVPLMVGLALRLAQLLHMEKAYWVPVSCLAVIQGASLRAVWTKQLQRLLGTAVGLLVSWGLLAEAATHGHADASALVEARFWDTVLGCLVGLLGGARLHSQALRQRAGGALRQLLPSKLVP
ncbi:MAG: FUSC family protein [Aquabacterium sp.]|uniref:FUSC family protein n=1 Tax=Aquabacterium sp. TaxID=1872578 RepID=UPI003BD02A37